ncbi:unnamed protein product, partial [Dovyalis caffra]
MICLRTNPLVDSLNLDEKKEMKLEPCDWRGKKGSKKKQNIQALRASADLSRLIATLDNYDFDDEARTCTM